VLVSIIIPVYNCEKYIEQAILSAVHQSYHDFEIIVVNDGSTDKTLHIILELMSKFPHIRLFSKKNGGPASALNAGIEQAKGTWIKWLSADDEMYPHCLEQMMAQAKYTDVIYYSHYDYIDEDGKITGEFIEPDHPVVYLWERFFGNGSSTLIHREVFAKCGLFNAALPHSEDYEFWLRATQVYGTRMQLVPIKTIRYRRHSGQLTNKVGGSLDKIIKEKIRERQAASG